jgi:cysteine desulfurase/selenocysteine lyase
MNIGATRRLFPLTNNYTYLNTAGCGLMSVQTVEAARNFYDEFYALAILGKDEWIPRTEYVRKVAAGFLNVEADQLAFVPDVATAANHVAHMFREPVEVLLVANEFPSVSLPWYAAGHEVKLVKPGENGEVIIEKIEEAVTGKTKILCISHVHFDTGYRNDLKPLGDLCRSKNIIFLVDSTQSLGAFPLDIKESNIDILVSNCYKWITAGFGITLMYVSKTLTDHWNIPALGCNSMDMVAMKPGGEMMHLLRKGAPVLEVGQPEYENIFRLGSAIELLSSLGLDNIHARVSMLTDHLYSRLKENNITIHFEQPAKNRSSLVMAEGTWDTVVALKKKNIIVSPSKGKGIRISPHFYNTEEEIDLLCEELRKLKA